MTDMRKAPLLAAAMLLVCLGCAGSNQKALEPNVELTLEPSPPKVGETQVTLSLTHQGEPIKRAQVRLEGNMNHAGMKPSFADLQEVEPGRYQGTLNFTMGGDWFILVDADAPDGRRFKAKVDVPGVKTP